MPARLLQSRLGGVWRAGLYQRPSSVGIKAILGRRTITFFSPNSQLSQGGSAREKRDPPSLEWHNKMQRAELQHTEDKKPRRGPGIEIPPELQHIYIPKPIRDDFVGDQPLTTANLENLEVYPNAHREPNDISDRIALTIVKILRKPTDLFFRKKYVHRAVMLETVAAVPGMVGGVVRHLRGLRGTGHDGGWIAHLLHEAENERMHLMTWMTICVPNFFDRALVVTVQGIFFNAFFLLYLLSPRTAHRMTGYLEEEAIISYTAFLKEIDAGRIKNSPAPKIAVEYWNLDPKSATLRDVVLAVRADEALHRDTNHHFSDRMLTHVESLHQELQNADFQRVHEDPPRFELNARQVFPKSASKSS